MKEKVVRISVTIPKNLYKEFEAVAKSSGFRKRSKAVSEALKKFILEYKKLESLPKVECTGTITYTYRHDVPKLLESLLDIQHHYHDAITSLLHVHLDPERCLETIVFRGDVETFKKVVMRLKNLRTENVQYVVVPHGS
jgi:CopG family nickel-responsive transcriptional regulator